MDFKTVDEAFNNWIDLCLSQRPRADRTGVGTREVFAETAKFDLDSNFPLLSLKKTPIKMGVEELCWMLSGSNNINDLPAHIQPWWQPWAKEDGDLGTSYGHQFTRGGQWVDLLQELAQNPYSRRLLISLWNRPAVATTVLPPCHGTVIQFWCDGEGGLHSSLYQRSADLLVGLPINVSTYGVLTKAVALHVSKARGELIRAKSMTYTVGCLHLYSNHEEVAEELLDRKLNDHSVFVNITKESLTAAKPSIKFSVDGYRPHGAVRMPIAV